MELEALGQLYLEGDDRKRQKRSNTNGASSSRDVLRVEVQQSCFDVNKRACKNVTFVGKRGKPKVFSYPERIVLVMTTEQLEKDICEVCDKLREEENCKPDDFAIDDLHGTNLPMEQVLEARREEMSHMKGHTFEVVKRLECFKKTGKVLLLLVGLIPTNLRDKVP